MIVKCPKCQTDNPADSRFCKECAAPLNASQDVSGTKTFQTPLKGISKETLIAGKYTIIEKLGEGGMGVVYKAKDTRLDRTVALKFLPSDLTQDLEAKQRFLQEAKAAAALDHPNICTVYEVDETEGQSFIAMSYIQGQNLKEKIKEGPLNIDEAKDIAIQVAEGLREAHEKGIIHRDIKPANIMLTEKGQAKITDFGLAKLSWGVDLTKTSSVMGTAAYMSPEQARGDKVDHRTDIWSFGAMLYEMFSGRRPFRSTDERAVFYSILNEKPEPMGDIRAEIPEVIEQIVMKAMEKEPSHRYQQMDDLLKDLKDNRSASAAPEQKKSIIVLPFDNISPESEQEYFCDGMTEEIINGLTHIKDLKVIARTSAFMFKGKNEDIREIGRKLAVNHLLEGSVRKAGKKIRITAQLINVEDGSLLWSEKFDRNLEDIFDIQDDIALAIVDALEVTLLQKEKQALLTHSTNNEHAYNLYLQGRFYWNRMTLHELENAETCFKKAIERDPNFALAHFGLADTYWVLHQLVPLPAREAMPKAKEAALKALELDSTLAEAYALAGMILYAYEWKWAEAEEYFKKAYSINPGSGPVKMYYSSFLQLTDRKSEAIHMMEETLETDPYSLVFSLNVATRLYMAKRYEEAIRKIEDILRMEPNFSLSYGLMGRTYICMGLYDKAEKALMKINELTGGRTESLPMLGYVYAKQGKKREAERILRRLDKESQNRYVPAFYYTYIYNGLGSTDKTFAYLNKAVQERDPLVAWWIRDELFANLRNDPRYAYLIRTLGQGFLEPELMEQFPAEQPKPSIIVLPFVNISPDPDQEYFSDGLTEEIITDLSHIHDLLVISRSSAMTFKGSKKKIKDIAGEVNVRYVLEGSVRKAGNNLRITAQLIDADSDAHLWADKYSGTLDDVFDIQEKVSRSIAGALKIQLNREEHESLAERGLPDIQAYECYLKARHAFCQWTEDGFDRALGYLQEALNIVGDNALLLAGLGYMYFNYVNLGFRDEDYLDKAEASARAALKLDPFSAKSHFVLSLIDSVRGDTIECLCKIKKALSLDPNDPDTLFWLISDYSLQTGKTEAAIPLVDRLLKRDPLNANSYLIKGLTSFFAGRFEEALAPLEKACTMDPGNPPFQFWRVQTLFITGRKQEAWDVIEAGQRLFPDHPFQVFCVLLRSAVKGKIEPLKTLDKALVEMAERDPYYSAVFAEFYAILNDKERALDWLEHAYQRGYFNYPFIQHHDPFYVNIRGEDRFKKLMEKVKHQWEKIEV